MTTAEITYLYAILSMTSIALIISQIAEWFYRGLLAITIAIEINPSANVAILIIGIMVAMTLRSKGVAISIKVGVWYPMRIIMSAILLNVFSIMVMSPNFGIHYSAA
jgi:hypothetical protein